MITVFCDAFKSWLFYVSSACDLALFARLVLCVSPLVTGFYIALRRFGDKKVRFGSGALTAYLFVSAVYFLLAYADALSENKIFTSVRAAAISGGAVFFEQIACYILFVVAAADTKKPKKRFAAFVSESPIPHVDDMKDKAYPLKSNLFAPKNGAADFDYDGFLDFLDKMGEKPFSFCDKEEYNRIVREAKFLSGVAVTKDTTPEFCSLFMRSVKLAAKYETD